MGKKTKSGNSLGRSLIKDRFGSSNRGRRAKDSSLLHTSEVPDGYDWGRLNLQSVTEESSFQEFLSTAELAGTEFQAEKLNITFVNPNSGIGLLSEEEKAKLKEAHKNNKEAIGIPRRPKWDETTTAEQLQADERDQFLEWRRRLALLQEVDGLLLTPYEKNLEFWRQLWRVVERSDVVVQIVDARNPLLFRCQDLEHYTTEVSPHKKNLILLNKADFLTPKQRDIWAQYFSDLNVQVAFFSATQSMEEKEEDEEEECDEEEEGEEEVESTVEGSECLTSVNESELKENDSLVENVSKRIDNLVVSERSDGSVCNMERTYQPEGDRSLDPNFKKTENSSKLLNRQELIELFHNLHTGPKVTAGVTTIGLVGYPNVGKSSTINALLTYKKVSVSATPGKTKHFQTLYLDKDLLLCDCPGLVMPSFVFTKAEMVVNGILPIDQMRDHVPPVTLVASLIPRHVLEDAYGIMIPTPAEGEDSSRPPTSEELLNAYGYNRGFMTQNGQPDNPRSARYVLKDFVNGKLLYCHAPPGHNQEEFHIFPERSKPVEKHLPERGSRLLKSHRITGEDLDQAFFKKSSPGVHSKGVSANIQVQSVGSASTSVNGSMQSIGSSKPWKDHHNKRNKREKLRRVYAHLDQ
ncbi:large subunit GTPase 1 homolog [Anabrus simplex]|uniref:large subunit GTPase 1 homolog n=1 Tax=Anabrus simplex TaxID=316456 RepID=UPI0035A3B26A